MSDDAAIGADLRSAATYRFLSLLFTTPSQEGRDELTALAGEVSPALAAHAREIAEASGPALQGLYHQVLGASGQVPDVECAYDDNTAGGRGPLVADVAGFYRAFAYDHRGPCTQDHIAAELDFLGWLSLKSAYARHRDDLEHLEVTRDARAKFVKDHLGRWAVTFLERLALVGEGTHYEAVAVLASKVLRDAEGDVFDRPDARLRLPVLDEPGDVESCGGA